jgi:hypothetical protein
MPRCRSLTQLLLEESLTASAKVRFLPCSNLGYKVLTHGKTFYVPDIYTIDEQLMMALRSYLSTIMSVASTIVVISFVTPLFTVCLVPILIYYALQQKFFTVSCRGGRAWKKYRFVTDTSFITDDV